MYKQVETDKVATLDNGVKFSPSQNRSSDNMRSAKKEN